MRLSAANFGFFYHSPLLESVRRIAALGYREIELTVGYPHIVAGGSVDAVAAGLRAVTEEVGVSIATLNSAELNLISPIPQIREASVEVSAWCLELAAALGTRDFVLIPGRRSTFAPMPDEEALPLFDANLARLTSVAERVGVTIALETCPFGFFPFASEIAAAIGRNGSPSLGIAVDAANVLTAGHDPVDELRDAGDLLRVAHFSGSYRDRLAHTRFDLGDVDLPAFVAELDRVGFDGPVTYELADGTDPEPVLREQAPELARLGFDLEETA